MPSLHLRRNWAMEYAFMMPRGKKKIRCREIMNEPRLPLSKSHVLVTASPHLRGRDPRRAGMHARRKKEKLFAAPSIVSSLVPRRPSPGPTELQGPRCSARIRNLAFEHRTNPPCSREQVRNLLTSWEDLLGRGVYHPCWSPHQGACPLIMMRTIQGVELRDAKWSYCGGRREASIDLHRRARGGEAWH
ncbi:hypothetical protein EV126DRAFT_57259 [Verticillium dahliae]|nr:hypothetical protein EV126DRAFT_57259 [Verticillium dahliae]